MSHRLSAVGQQPVQGPPHQAGRRLRPLLRTHPLGGGPRGGYEHLSQRRGGAPGRHLRPEQPLPVGRAPQGMERLGTPRPGHVDTRFGKRPGDQGARFLARRSLAASLNRPFRLYHLISSILPDVDMPIAAVLLFLHYGQRASSATDRPPPR